MIDLLILFSVISILFVNLFAVYYSKCKYYKEYYEEYYNKWYKLHKKSCESYNIVKSCYYNNYNEKELKEKLNEIFFNLDGIFGDINNE